MYWKLQQFNPDCGRWVDTDVGPNPVIEFKGREQAFDYYFGKHGYKRHQETRYRLAPVFSTEPIEIRQHKQTVRIRWALDGFGTHPIYILCCPNCGTSKRDRRLGH